MIHGKCNGCQGYEVETVDFMASGSGRLVDKLQALLRKDEACVAMVRETDETPVTERFRSRAIWWLMRHGNDLERESDEVGTFLEDLLVHPKLGMRSRYELAQHPGILHVIPIERRFALLDALVSEFGPIINYWWVEVARGWSVERTQALLDDVLTNPEQASAFLCGRFAWMGWRVCQTADTLVSVLRRCAMVAPFEVLRMRDWIMVMIGALKEGYVFTNEDVTSWLSDPAFLERFARRFCIDAREETDAIMRMADRRLTFASEKDDSRCSRQTRSILQQVRQLPELRSSIDLQSFATLLLELPECEVAHGLLDRVCAVMTPENAAIMYRHLLSVSENDPKLGLVSRADEVLVSWWNNQLRYRLMQAGWEFHRVEERVRMTSNGRSVELYVTPREAGRGPLQRVIVVHDDRDKRFGPIRAKTEVMILGDRRTWGDPTFEEGRLRVHRVQMQPVQPFRYAPEFHLKFEVRRAESAA